MIDAYSKSLGERKHIYRILLIMFLLVFEANLPRRGGGFCSSQRPFSFIIDSLRHHYALLVQNLLVLPQGVYRYQCYCHSFSFFVSSPVNKEASRLREASHVQCKDMRLATPLGMLRFTDTGIHRHGSHIVIVSRQDSVSTSLRDGIMNSGHPEPSRRDTRSCSGCRLPLRSRASYAHFPHRSATPRPRDSRAYAPRRTALRTSLRGLP